MHLRPWAAALALALAAVAASGGPAAAGPEIQADGTVSVGYSRSTQETGLQEDPLADPVDIPDNTSSRIYSEVRPGISILSGTPRLIWRLGYQLSANFSPDGDPSFTNQVNGELGGQPTKYTALTLAAVITQGGTLSLASQRSAETGQVEIRAPGNPSQVTATLMETLSWEAGKLLRVGQSLGGTASAPQDDLGAANGSAYGSLVFEQVFKRYAAGLEVRSTVSRLRPLQADLQSYTTVINTFLLRFNHDFSWRWNGFASAGVEQVYTTTGSEPLALLPTANATAVYTVGNTAAAVELSHGSLTNIQVGTVSVTDRVALRGAFTLNAQKLRVLSFSAGFLHNEPLGESEELVAAGTGNALQADAGFTTEISKNIQGSARYSLAYQYGQAGGIEPLVAHTFFVAVTAHYSNVSQPTRQVPSLGRRVDGSDRKGFPAGGNPVGGEDRGGRQ